MGRTGCYYSLGKNSGLMEWQQNRKRKERSEGFREEGGLWVGLRPRVGAEDWEEGGAGPPHPILQHRALWHNCALPNLTVDHVSLLCLELLWSAPAELASVCLAAAGVALRLGRGWPGRHLRCEV